MEEKLNDLEQYTKKTNVIIHGLALKKSYAQAAANHSRQAVEQTHATRESSPNIMVSEREKFADVKSQVLDFFDKSLGVHLAESDIGAAHELKRGSKDKVTPLIVRYTSSAAKKDVLVARRRARDVFINEQLTQKNSALFRDARALRKDRKVFATWTRDGRIYLKQDEHSSVKEIKSPAQLSEYK